MSLLFALPISSRIFPPLFLTCIRRVSRKQTKKSSASAITPTEPPTLESHYLDPMPKVDLQSVCYGLNYHTTGSGEEVQLKDPSEYPDWLWTLLDPVPEDLSNPTYARRLRKAANRERNRFAFYKKRWPGWEKYYPKE